MRSFIVICLLCVATALPTQDFYEPSVKWETECGTSRYVDAGFPPPSPITQIYGGWDARRGEWPWQVSMRNAPEGANHYCGAVILNDGWIVTAAHCCEGELAIDVYTVVGEYDLDEDDLANPDREVYRVTDIIMHEDYGPISLINDICLLKTLQNITFTENVQPACPPVDGNDYVTAVSAVSGWGDTQGQPTSILQTTNLQVITNQVCYESLSQVDPSWLITADMICAGHDAYDERDTCQGDSGGPMVTKNAADKFEVIGLTSWGSGCAAGHPGVYHRVSHSLAWIDSKINA